MGESGRGKRAADAEVNRAEFGARNAQEAKSDALSTLSVPFTISQGEGSKPLEPAIDDPAPVLTPVTAAPLDLRPLDPAQNGVLDLLKRIERNTQAQTPKQRAAAGPVGSDGVPVARSRPARDAAGRFTSTQALTQSGDDTTNASGLRQQIMRVKRIERQAENTLPPVRRPGVVQDSETGTTPQADSVATPTPTSKGGDTTANQGRQRETTANARPANKARERKEQRDATKESAKATAEATAKANAEAEQKSTSDAQANDASSDDTTPTLTAEQLRALPLRDDGGRFLSRDEKAGMSQAQLAQARAREQRDKAQQDEKANGMMGKLVELADGALGSQGDASDGAGTAAGGAYYMAAKEVYSAVNELAGENSKGRQLYDWAQAKWAEKRDKEAGQEKSDTVEASGEPSETLAIKRQTRDAKQQHQETRDEKAAEADAQEARHRADTTQADDHHKDTTDRFDALTRANEEGFEEVVEAIERIPPPDGSGMSVLPIRNPLSGGARGGARGGGARHGGGASGQPRGRLGRLWDRVRGRTPATTPSAGASSASAATRTASAANTANAASTATRAASAAPKTTLSTRAVQAASTVGRGATRLAGAAAAPLTGYLAWRSTQEELGERGDLTDSQKTAISGGSAVGAGGGALAGAGMGAAAGAVAGSVVPVIGTAIGGVLGGVVGGALGAWGGEQAGRSVGEAVASTMDNVEDEARKALDEREARLNNENTQERKWYNPATWFSGGGSQAQGQASFGGMPGAGARGDRAPTSSDASIIERSNFGRVAEKYESGGMGVGTISTGYDDAGGVSYGKHQLASETGTMQAFLNSREGAAYRDEFAGMRAGSDDFSAKYREVAERDAEGFAAAQQAFITRTHYEPVANYAASKGIDIESEAMQEALYSQSVQHSGRGNRVIIDDAMSRVGPDASEDEIIDALYDARGDYASQFANRSATIDRYAREREDVRAISQARAAEASQDDAAPHEPDAGATVEVANSNGGSAPAEANATAQPAPAVAANTAQPAVEPAMEGAPVEPVDNRQAAQASRPAAPTPTAPPASIAKRSEPASQGGSNGANGRNGEAGTGVRGDTSAPGVNDVAMHFDDTTLTLMAMDRI